MSENKLDRETLLMLSGIITGAEDLEAMANQFDALLVASLEIKGASVFILNFETNELELLTSAGLSSEFLGKGPIAAEKLLKDVIKGEMVLIEDTEQGNRLQYPAEVKKEGIRSEMSLPIRFGEHVCGVLRLYHHRVWDISDGDLKALVALTGQLGLALRYSRLMHAMQSIEDVITFVGTGCSE